MRLSERDIKTNINSEIHASLRRLEEADYVSEIVQQQNLSAVVDQVNETAAGLSTSVGGLQDEAYQLHEYIAPHIFQGDLQYFQNAYVGTLMVEDGGQISGQMTFTNATYFDDYVQIDDDLEVSGDLGVFGSINFGGGDLESDRIYGFGPHTMTVDGTELSQYILSTGDITFNFVGLAERIWSDDNTFIVRTKKNKTVLGTTQLGSLTGTGDIQVTANGKKVSQSQIVYEVGSSENYIDTGARLTATIDASDVYDNGFAAGRIFDVETKISYDSNTNQYYSWTELKKDNVVFYASPSNTYSGTQAYTDGFTEGRNFDVETKIRYDSDTNQYYSWTELKKNGTVFYSSPSNTESGTRAYEDGWTAAFGDVSLPTTNSTDDFFTIETPNSTVDGTPIPTTYTMRDAQKNVATLTNPAGTVVARLPHNRYNGGWAAAWGDISLPGAASSGEQLSFDVTVPSQTVDGTPEPKTFTLSKGTPGTSGYASVSYGGNVVGRIDISNWYTTGRTDGRGQMGLEADANDGLVKVVQGSTTNIAITCTEPTFSYDATNHYYRASATAKAGNTSMHTATSITNNSGTQAYEDGWDDCVDTKVWSGDASKTLGYDESITVSASVKDKSGNTVNIGAATYVAPSDNWDNAVATASFSATVGSGTLNYGQTATVTANIQNSSGNTELLGTRSYTAPPDRWNDGGQTAWLHAVPAGTNVSSWRVEGVLPYDLWLCVGYVDADGAQQYIPAYWATPHDYSGDVGVNNFSGRDIGSSQESNNNTLYANLSNGNSGSTSIYLSSGSWSGGSIGVAARLGGSSGTPIDRIYVSAPSVTGIRAVRSGNQQIIYGKIGGSSERQLATISIP